MKSIQCLLLTAAIFCFSQAWADVPPPSSQGVFASVTGKVNVHHKGRSRKAHRDSTISEGDRVVTGDKSSAVLRFFDGSELSINADSSVGLTKLQKPTALDKLMKFKIFFGQLLAKVQKLASAKSSFEVEAGGVVCGVRGTWFEMGYNPGNGKVGLDVKEGSVWVTVDGQTHTFGAGQQGVFNGHSGEGSHNGQGGNGGQGGHGTSGGNNGSNGNSGNTNGNNGDNGNGGSQGGGQGDSGTGGNGGQGNGGSGSGLQDLNNEFNSGGSGNGNKTITDPDVEGSTRVNVHVKY